ncbi:MAG: hypothetical protein NTU47_15355 [Ignavibacteriales bacterium]|nr:hypothetical protein [Ignavibacteriales bacterium]
MTSQRILRGVLALGLATLVQFFGAAAQVSGLSAALVLRSQAAGIAEESYSAMNPSRNTLESLGVAVTGGTARALVENAFLDLFGRKGIRISLQGSEVRAKNQLHVTILDQSVRYAGLADGQYRREIQTAIEARQTSNDTGSAQYLGVFKRQVVDTVAFREDGGAVALIQDTERTLLDRLLGPVLLIGGAFLIVFLFFTVRN